MAKEIAPSGQRPDSPSGPPEMRASHADRDRAVEVLRVAAGDGRLTADELDERVEAALTARTVRELAMLTADLPGGSALTGPEVRDVLRIERRFSAIRKAGPWTVPRRLEVVAEWCAVTLDFSQAVITHDTLRVDLDMRGKTLTLVTRPGVVVHSDTLELTHCRMRDRQEWDPGTPVELRVELVGRKSYGRIVVRPPRRGFGRSSRRRSALPGAAD